MMTPWMLAGSNIQHVQRRRWTNTTLPLFEVSSVQCLFLSKLVLRTGWPSQKAILVPLVVCDSVYPNPGKHETRTHGVSQLGRRRRLNKGGENRDCAIYRCWSTGTRSAAYGKLFLLRYGAAQPDISIVNNGMQIASDFNTLP